MRPWSNSLEMQYPRTPCQNAILLECFPPFQPQVRVLFEHNIPRNFRFQENSEMLFLDERSVLFRPESGRDANGIDADLSGGESFASAQDQVRKYVAS